MLGRAPEFTGNQAWFNTPGRRPLTMSGLRGKVVLVDFWTYTCINCIRTLPHLKEWDERYRNRGLEIVGVHTPEFPFERDEDNVRDAIAQNGLRYAVAQDNVYATWNAYSNQYWPAKYLIDARGRVRYAHFGEGAYAETERAVPEPAGRGGTAPAARAGLVGPRRARLRLWSPPPRATWGHAGADRFASGPLRPGAGTYRLPDAVLAPDSLALGGRWRIGADSATSVGSARLQLDFGARRVFLVLGSAGGRPRAVKVLMDGKPLPDRYAGEDVRSGRVLVRRQRLYRLIDLPRAERQVF